MKNQPRSLILFLSFAALCLSCHEDNMADTIVQNAQIHTVNLEQPEASAMAFKDGLIIAIGSKNDVLKFRGKDTEVIDLEGQFVLPGFIEGHGHFGGLGNSLVKLNFLKTKNWQEVTEMVSKEVNKVQPGDWIIGRGWHQEKWDKLPENYHGDYPIHTSISAISADNPIMLIHASGHSLFANAKAMEIAGISNENSDPSGGHIVKDPSGSPIGIFEERAMQPIRDAYSEWEKGLSQEQKNEAWQRAFKLANEKCLENGVTSFQDAGSTLQELRKWENEALKGNMKIRMWAMVRQTYEEMKDSLDDFPKIGLANNYYTCRAIKSEIDGALGAYGAWLLKSYNDKPDFHGQNTTSLKEVSQIADLAAAKKMQLCVHAIGDKGNQVILDLFEGKAGPGDHRWRVEHAQHLHPNDIKRFKPMGAIASMQGIHCTSDAPFVVKRLGEQRAKEGAYAWRSLWNEGVVVSNGTDVPVEDISPIENFYATVTRKRIDNKMEFYTEQSLSREEAIKSMTLNPAYAAFEEQFKGSLQKGKVADFIVLSNDLLTCGEEDILKTRINKTFVGGKELYSRDL